MKKFAEVEIDAIPEVRVYQQARARWDKYIADHKEFFDGLEKLGEELNDKLEAAEKVVRTRKVSCGDFVRYQNQLQYKADILFAAMGRERALSVGGKVETKASYDVDKALIDANIANGNIPPEVAEKIRLTIPRYKVPNKIQFR